MGSDPKRQRLSSALGLWAVVTRAVLNDDAKTGWGVSLALLCTAFFFFVGKSQRKWLGQSHGMWWSVACRADVAAFFAMTSPVSMLLPLLVFIVTFKGTARVPHLVEGGALWRNAPLLLLLYPRRWYGMDVVGVAMLVAARHRDPADMQSEHDYHKEHEIYVLSDILACLVLTCAGAPMYTRLALLLGTALLACAVHLKYPRDKIGYWDLANHRAHPKMPITFRGVNPD